MSKSKAELSNKEKMLIELVIFRTNPKHPTFFGDNENIAKCLDIKPDTVRKAIKKLKDLEYLAVTNDTHGRRHISYTGKPFARTMVDMRNVDKKVLKQEKEYYEREAQYVQHELELSKYRLEFLEQENSRLQNKLFCAELRVSQLENLFLVQGCTKEQIDSMIKQTQQLQEAA